MAGNSPRFRLRTLLLWVAFVAVACWALVRPSPWLAALVSLVPALVLAWAVVAAVCTIGSRRVFWIAFAAFGLTSSTTSFAWSIYELGQTIWRRSHGGQAFASAASASSESAFTQSFASTVLLVIATIAAYICQAVYIAKQAQNQPGQLSPAEDEAATS